MRPATPQFIELEMRDAHAQIDDPQRVRSMLHEDGYLYLPGIIEAGAIKWAREQMVKALVEQGLLSPAASARLAEGEISTEWTGHRIAGVGLPGKQVQTPFKKRRIWETFVEIPSVRGLFEQIAGEPVRFLPISEYRTAPPGWSTPMHHDGFVNYGYEMHTAWFPVMPIDQNLGGLAVLAKTPGRSYPTLMATADVPGDLALEPNWRRADYHPGDLVIFEELTVHCGSPNRTDNQLRLSFELRFQGISAPKPVIGPIIRITPNEIAIAEEGGGQVSLAIDDATRLRGDRFRNSNLISRWELATSDLTTGFPVIVAHRNGAAVSVRGIF